MTGLSGKLSWLVWPIAIGTSLAAHAAAAVWLTGQDGPQRDGDPDDAPAILVAFVPAPAPAEPPRMVLPQAPAALEPGEPDSAPDLPAVDPVTLPEPAKPLPEPPKRTEAPPKADAAPAAAPKPKEMAVAAKPKDPKPKEKPEAKPTEKAKPAPKAKPAAAGAASKTAKAGNPAGNKKWASKIRSRIERKKSYPAAAQGAAGSVKVRLRIAASGALGGVTVVGSSGNAALDAAALKAVTSAAPFPAAPAGSDGAEFSLTMTFQQ